MNYLINLNFNLNQYKMNEELKEIEENKAESNSTVKTDSEPNKEGELSKKKEEPKTTTSTEGAGEVIKPFISK